MLLEPIRIVADWLADATYGVNALRLTVPVDAGDAQPGAVTIGDATRDGNVARGRLPDPATGVTNLIAVDLTGGGTFDGGVLTTVRDGTVPVVIRIGTPNEVTEDGTRDGLYLARVVCQSLKVLAEASHVADRTRNSVVLLDMPTLAMQPLFQPMEDQSVTAAVVATFKVRDLAP